MVTRTQFYESQGRPTIRYQSGETIYEERVQNGRFVGLYWTASGQPYGEGNVDGLPCAPDELAWKRAESFALTVDGQSLHNRWEHMRSYLRGTDGERNGDDSEYNDIGEPITSAAGTAGAQEEPLDVLSDEFTPIYPEYTPPESAPEPPYEILPETQFDAYPYAANDAESAPQAVVELRHALRPITLRVVTKLDGSPFLTRWLEITNTGDQPAAIGAVLPFQSRLWENRATHQIGGAIRVRTPNPPEALYSLGRLQCDVPEATLMGNEGNFQWEPITAERTRIERRERKPYASPYFLLRNNVTGERFTAALAWSAGYVAEVVFDKRDLSLRFAVGPDAPEPQRVLLPGETAITPPVHIGPTHGAFDDSVAAWYDHLRTSVLPTRPEGKSLYTIAGRVVERPGDWIFGEIDTAAEMGAEAFMVDAGWYGELFDIWPENRGDWYEGDFLPEGGLARIRAYVHSRDMLFGLWMEPEAISLRSQLYHTHPEWRVSYDGADTFTMGGHGVLDLSQPDAARFFRETVLDIVGEKQLDFFKLDFNMDVTEGGQHEIAGYAENQAWRHFEALYGTFEQLRRQYPDVALENCASGGGRNDLGMLSRFHYASQSDWSIFPFSIRAINGMTLFLPPETLVYYHNHMAAAPSMAEAETHLRVALFCNPIFVGFGAQNAAHSGPGFERTRAIIALLKGFCRPILSRPNVYHHTPDIGLYAPAEWCVLEYARDGAGYVGLFRLGTAPDCHEYRLRPRGVELAKTYRVTFANSGQSALYTGKELQNEGLCVRVDARNHSELVLYCAE